MWTQDDYARRLRHIHRDFEARLDRDVTQAELGVRVGEILDRAPPAQATVSGWLRGAVPEPAVLVALARIYGVDPGHLLFGPDSLAPKAKPTVNLPHEEEHPVPASGELPLTPTARPAQAANSGRSHPANAGGGRPSARHTPKRRR